MVGPFVWTRYLDGPFTWIHQLDVPLSWAQHLDGSLSWVRKDVYHFQDIAPCLLHVLSRKSQFVYRISVAS